ncbi:Transposon Ty3-I Gag-Pol polyprotein [Labeo rohita]|uniref:Gypsy retrotransposon integrase-like protein 1 n=1 Tax=Labeo rohita TaxID=84645 RepID=A0ABQ8L276_LABRO|nr:Transposon Ty3-I Gag-Pol polyprotein [Labeo rohita]
MPTEDPTPPACAWLAGCVLHHKLPQGAPRVEVKTNGRPALALLDSGSSVSLIKAAIMPPRKDSKTGPSKARITIQRPILSHTSLSEMACCIVSPSGGAGHLGTANTIQHIRDRFHWPGLDGEVKRFCQACLTCQLTSPKLPPPSPLIPLPIIEVPFERIGMDLVGPLPKSARSHEHVLVIIDYATRYPEAIPLRKVTAKATAKELFLLCTRVGIPAEILTDQGTPFMWRLMADLCRLLQMKQLRTTVYHPQTDGGLLDIAREAWEQQQPTPLRSVVEHVREMCERIEKVMPLVREHMVKVQQSQQRLYNRAAQPQEFQPGDKVMVLVPTATCKFLMTWHGPYTVIEWVGPVNYRLRQPGKRQEEQLYHVKLLKRWVGTREQLSALAHTDPMVVNIGEHLLATQKTELQHLIIQFSDVFSTRPGRTNVIKHDIRTPPGVIVRQRPYRVPEARRHAIEDEIGEMLKLGVIEPSRSAWSSPIVMVPKPDGTLRFCNDFRRLNQVSEFDGYLMPRVDELLERLGRARFISTLDLTKGYWQVPLTKTAKEKTAFSTPSGHWQYRTVPFGLHGAPAMFQRMMDILLLPHLAYAAAYLDNAQYLGFRVGRGLIRPQQKKVGAILSAPRPTTKTQVRAFLGLAGYYRCFIPNFSTLASPLTDLTRKGQPEKIIWNTTLDKALQDIKITLTTEPVL